MHSGSLTRQLPLSLGTILDAATEVVDEEGLDALSMRRLARRLDVAPMSLYEYVDSKAALERALADRITSASMPPLHISESESPRDRVVWTARNVRQQLLEHPGLVPLVIRYPGPREDAQPESLINLDRSIEMARADGWSDDEIPVLLASLVQFTLGFLLYETGRLEHGPFHDNVVRLRSLVSDPSGLPEGEVRGMVLQQFLPDRAEETFEAGVTALYDGLLSRRS